MRVCFYTLGCKVNQNETGALAQLFEQNGFTVVEEKDGADVYVVNSCTVTNFGRPEKPQMAAPRQTRKPRRGDSSDGLLPAGVPGRSR